jgi:hypothetical protein
MIPVVALRGGRHEYGEAVVENRYAALVKGSSAIFPRGFLWLIPVWYTAIAVLVKVKAKPPAWYAPYALGATILAVLTLLAVLLSMRNNAFVADDSGIGLGLRGGARRRFGRRRRETTHLPWPDVQQLKIASRPYGARLDILLHRDAIIDRHRVIWLIAANCVTVLLPVAYLFRSPGLVRPRSYDPPRYRIQIYDVGPEELRLALAPLTPPTVVIAVRRTWRSRALGRLRRSRLATAA